MLNNKKSYIYVLIICIIFSLTLSPVFADTDGYGTGSGNGENKDIPLTLVSSSVEDGASGVALNETIQLNFNKNICNVTVLANNKLCFHLTDSNGEPVAIKLIFPDNQVQHEHRREVFIIPKDDLEPETAYCIYVDNTLTAKNGTVIDDAHTISFTTGSEYTSSENAVLKELGDYTITYETASGDNENSIPVNKEDLDNNYGEASHDTGSIIRITVIILISVMIIFSLVFLFIKRRKE